MALYLFSININQQDVTQALKLYDNHIFMTQHNNHLYP